MKEVRGSFHTTVPPERVLAAFVDFTDRRPDLWPNLSRKYFRVHAVDDGRAEVTEGMDLFGAIWARERYEWSDGESTATVIESNVFRAGSTYRLVVRPDGRGGTEGEIVWNKTGASLRGRIIARMVRLAGAKTLLKMFGKTLAMLEEEEVASSA